ncbi:hypothetical protein [Flammeovirga sp. SubArs3]|uniref:hypothetical protein n=1 Tax=Flammeovirga sp. SubArs3 TaxID=2995316 RepID=UPI00248C55D7|nr:hypothetical protein [Flammeovirga sp. SubArs3]
MRYILLLLLSFSILSFSHVKYEEDISENINYRVSIEVTNRIFSSNLEIINTPSDIAVKFINDYVENCNSKERDEIMSWINNYPKVSQTFKEELEELILEAEKNAPEIGLDFDPIFDAQDYPDDGFKLSNFDPTTNYLTVEGIHWEGFYITMKIKKYNNEWFIDGCGVINIPKSKQAKR